MMIKLSKDTVARNANSIREIIGESKKPIKLALPPAYPFNDDEYEELVLRELGAMQDDS